MEEPAPARVELDRRVLDFLVCPVTRSALIYDAERQELISKAANLAFPIHNGIPVMLVDEARMLED
ncbi:MAG: Trm112 family protein [Pseudomonadota bacterium]